MNKFLIGLGWFFGIVFLIVGILILLRAFFGGGPFAGNVELVGFFVLIIGVLACYGAHRAGNNKTGNDFFKEHEREFKSEANRRHRNRRDKNKP